jgi:hypothetical protein
MAGAGHDEHEDHDEAPADESHDQQPTAELAA